MAEVAEALCTFLACLRRKLPPALML
jgi:hypothetical protein